MRFFIFSQKKENCGLVFTIYAIGIGSFNSSSICYLFSEILGYYTGVRDGGWNEAPPLILTILTPMITQRATKTVVFKLPSPGHLQVIKSI